jgi:serine/threonine protein kinase
MQVDNLILEKSLGKGAFGEVFLTKKVGDNNKIYATKQYERDKIENTEAMKYLKNEIAILQTLNHPNIVKFEDVKKTKKHFYIVMEFCNGGELSKALEKYQLKYGKPFSQEIVQYLMRQIIDAFRYIHGQKIMHRDIKLDNILINFQNEKDKKELNMMKAQIKIIDFGFACKIAKDSLTYTAIGNPINMDPLILKKLNTPGRKARQLGYDQKADIWSLGAICYEMLIGRAAFDADDMEDLVNKVEDGKYKVPTSLSKEVISFLNGMLQYQPTQRLTIEQLYSHPFLANNIQNFHSIDLRQVSNKLDKNKKEIIIDVKKNKSIWAIFNQEDENKLNNIPGQLVPIPEVNERNNERKKSQENHLNNKNEDDGYPIRTTNTYQIKQKMGLNNYSPFMNNINNYNNYNRPYGPYLAMQGIPGNQMYQIPMPQMQMQQLGAGANQTISAAPTTESYTFSGGNIYGIK